MKEKFINPYKMFRGSFTPDWLLERPTTDISSTEKLVYSKLCQYAGKNGKCFPKQDTIAKKLGVTTITIHRAIKNLVEHKLISKVQNGLGKSNSYSFLWHEWMETEEEKAIPELSPVISQETSSMIVPEPSPMISPIYKENHIRDSVKYKEKAVTVPVTKSKKSVSPKESNKPCDKYNYTFGDLNGFDFLKHIEETKKAYISLLENNYYVKVNGVFRDNLTNAGKKQKYFKALTTFLLEWSKENPTRIKSFKEMVRIYFRKCFMDIEKGSAHQYYKENYPLPQQIITDNSIEIWNFFWKNNPMLEIKPKTYTLEVMQQQAEEKRIYGQDYDSLNRYLIDNCVDLATFSPTVYQDLREKRAEIKKYREKCLLEKKNKLLKEKNGK